MAAQATGDKANPERNWRPFPGKNSAESEDYHADMKLRISADVPIKSIISFLTE
jgi:hypothetical protein